MCRQSVGVTATNVANGNGIVIATVRLRLTKYPVFFAALTPTTSRFVCVCKCVFGWMYARVSVHGKSKAICLLPACLPACCVFMAKFHVEFQRYFQLNKGGFSAIYLLSQHNNSNNGTSSSSNNNNRIEAIATIVVAVAVATITTTTTTAATATATATAPRQKSYTILSRGLTAMAQYYIIHYGLKTRNISNGEPQWEKKNATTTTTTMDTTKNAGDDDNDEAEIERRSRCARCHHVDS